jgi:hypothetical protein
MISEEFGSTQMAGLEDWLSESVHIEIQLAVEAYGTGVLHEFVHSFKI